MAFYLKIIQVKCLTGEGNVEILKISHQIKINDYQVGHLAFKEYVNKNQSVALNFVVVEKSPIKIHWYHKVQ